MQMTDSQARQAFLEAVRDGDDVYPLLAQIGYGWAVQEGLVTKHPAWMEFTLTAAGQQALGQKKTPLLKRLRSEAVNYSATCGDLFGEAADEIERLRSVISAFATEISSVYGDLPTSSPPGPPTSLVNRMLESVKD